GLDRALRDGWRQAVRLPHGRCADASAQSDLAHRQERRDGARPRAGHLADAGAARWAATGQRRGFQRWLQSATGGWRLCALVFVYRHRTNLPASWRTQAQWRGRAAAWAVGAGILAQASLRWAGAGATGSSAVRAFLYGMLPS